jgi:hypothetical protein
MPDYQAVLPVHPSKLSDCPGVSWTARTVRTDGHLDNDGRGSVGKRVSLEAEPGRAVSVRIAPPENPLRMRDETVHWRGVDFYIFRISELQAYFSPKRYTPL